MKKVLHSLFYALYILLALLLVFFGLSTIFFGDKADVGAALVMWMFSGAAMWLLVDQRKIQPLAPHSQKKATTNGKSYAPKPRLPE